MAKIYDSMEQLIGSTPLLRLNRLKESLGLGCDILAKLESQNPAGSVKDRVALYMLNDAEKSGLIGKGSVIIEPTSGNTGIGLAAVSAKKGYRTIIVMPDTMSKERIAVMKAYGAEIVLTDGTKGMTESIRVANEIAKNTKNSFVPNQFSNPDNSKIHYDTTGPEIFEDTDGKIDVFVAGVGTGGTITGVGEYLKKQNPNIEIVAVEPKSSPYISQGVSGSHGLQGIGAGFIPEILNTKIIDKIITVTEKDAYETARMLGKKEGVLVGISSGAALWAAIKLAKAPEYINKNIVVLLPDTGDRYLSTELFD